MPRIVVFFAGLFAILAFALTAEADPSISTESAAGSQTVVDAELTALARKTLNALQKSSIKGRREFCGYIGYNRRKVLTAMSARGGSQASCTMPRVPAGFVPVATYHTHGAFDLGYDNETPSFQDLRSDIDADLYGFISTPGGRLWFSDKTAREVRLICDARCLITDPRYSETRHDPVAPRYTLKDLARR